MEMVSLWQQPCIFCWQKKAPKEAFFCFEKKQG
jgi:hypothetical protein